MVTVTMTHAHIASTAGLVSIYLQCLQHKNTNHTLMPQWLFSFCFSSRPHHSILVIIMVHYQTGPRITSPLFWSLETARMNGSCQTIWKCACTPPKWNPRYCASFKPHTSWSKSSIVKKLARWARAWDKHQTVRPCCTLHKMTQNRIDPSFYTTRTMAPVWFF